MNMEEAMAAHRAAQEAFGAHLHGELADAREAMDRSIVFRPQLLERLKLAETRCSELHEAGEAAARKVVATREMVAA